MEAVKLRMDRYASLLENAAWRFGYASGEGLKRRTGAFHPGDPIGKLVCDAWDVDPHFAVRAFVEYMGGLREAALQQGVRPPSFSEVLAGLPLALNSARYPDLDMKQLIGYIASTAGDISSAL